MEKIETKLERVDIDGMVGMFSKDRTMIKFEGVVQNYGRAQFMICPIFKNGKIRKVFIYPRQQPNAKHFYVFENEMNGWEGLDLGECMYAEKKLSFPHVWVTHWCKEHKCHSMLLYVPQFSGSFFISTDLNRFSINWRGSDMTQEFVNGEVAIKYNEDDHEAISNFLNMLYPNDPSIVHGRCKYYIANPTVKTQWLGADQIRASLRVMTIGEINSIK